ncbi:ubiquitin-specific protease ubp2 [Coemansia sp. RSA 552]|nr:ubiquitin-specific protease ubp2 [Coemansia sp. RSA 552]
MADLHTAGVLAGYFANRQLAQWIPDDVRRQVEPQHRHKWVESGSSSSSGGGWQGRCRSCLCYLRVTVETEGVDAANGCVDAVGHHFHSALPTEAKAGTLPDSMAACPGVARCCKCAFAVLAKLQGPVVEPEMAAELEKARRSAHPHNPTQGTRALLDTVSTMYKLVKNACAGNARPIRLASEVPRRRLGFDAPCNQILEVMGFALVNGAEFCPPEAVRALVGEGGAASVSGDAKLMLQRLESARDELLVWAGQIQRRLPQEERQAVFAQQTAMDGLARQVGAQKYPRRAGSTNAALVEASSVVPKAYEALGVPEDAASGLVTWAYRRLTEEDQSSDPLFGAAARSRFDSLVAINAARGAAGELGRLVETERERGMVARGAVRAAAAALFGDPEADADSADSDTLREVFLARLAEATAPKARMELAEHLVVLADAKRDTALKKYAANVLSSLQTSSEIEAGGAAGVATWKGKVDTWEQLPVGLHNIGNTCYLNSILQCLFSILPIRKAIMCYGDGKTWNEQRTLGRQDSGQLLSQEAIATALKFVAQLKKLFEALVSQRVEAWAATRVRKNSGHPLATSTTAASLAVTPDRELADMLLLRFGNVTGPTSPNATYFPAGTSGQQQQQQQDVDECLAQCVGLLVHALPPESLVDAPEGAADPSGPARTWIYQLLAGQLVAKTEKPGPDASEAKEEPKSETFLNLNLNIPDSATDINDCIDAFFAPSDISSSASKDASEGSMDVDTRVRRTRIKDAPPVLCIQLQRVQFDMTTMRPFKINSHLRLREQISLTPYQSFDATHSRRHELQLRLRTVRDHLRTLQLPVEKSSANGPPLSVLPALERVQAFMAGVSRWSDTDSARHLLADLEEAPESISQNASEISQKLASMSESLTQSRRKWEDEQRDIQEQLEKIYNDVPADDMAYTLHAVFIHSGQSPEFGHYWVYVRDYDREKGVVRWLNFNDSHVLTADPSDIFRDAPKPGQEYANPYYLMYVRTKDIESTTDLGV